MKFNIVISATIFLLVAGCGEMRTPIDLESGSDSDATTNLETDCGDGVIQLGEACDGLNVGAMRCEHQVWWRTTVRVIASSTSA